MYSLHKNEQKYKLRMLWKTIKQNSIYNKPTLTIIKILNIFVIINCIKLYRNISVKYKILAHIYKYWCKNAKFKNTYLKL